jgi:hypothetical protein
MILLVDAICSNVINIPKIKLGQTSRKHQLMPLATYHWRESVRGMSFFVAKKVLIEVDRKLYDRIVSEFGRRVEMRRL